MDHVSSEFCEENRDIYDCSCEYKEHTKDVRWKAPIQSLVPPTKLMNTETTTNQLTYKGMRPTGPDGTRIPRCSGCAKDKKQVSHYTKYSE